MQWFLAEQCSTNLKNILTKYMCINFHSVTLIMIKNTFLYENFHEFSLEGL